jgi:serine/threonine-protein kinase
VAPPPPAPPKVEPPPPKPVEVATAATPASLRAAIQAAIAPVGCALLGGDVSGNQVRLNGVVADGSASLLDSAVAQAAADAHTEVQVAKFAGPYCGLLDTLRPVAARFGQPPSPLRIGLKSGAGVLHKDAYMIPRIAMPAWPAYLTVDYFQSDGTLAHLYPASDADRAHVYPSGGSVTLGDPASGASGWQVAPPFGTDMIVAIASAKPLFAKPRPDDDTPQTYLAALKAALATASHHVERVAADASVVQTAP